MRSADILRLRLRSLFRRSRVEAELAAELRFHLDQLTEENITSGMSPDEARHAALRAFGGVPQIQERCREMRGNRWIEQLVQDLSYAVRTFRRSPAFTLIAVFSLALGIGANTAIFSLINALLLRHLPVHEPSGLVAVGDPSRTGSLSTGNVRNDLMSYPLYEEIRKQNQVFTDVLASGRSGRLNVVLGPTGGEGEAARGRLVSGNYFSLLGVHALRGRTFTAEEGRAPGAAPFAVISHDYWTRRFSQEAGAVGRTIQINDHPFTIVGVMPPGFFGDIVGVSTDIWIPLSMQPQVNPGRNYLDRWDTSWLLLMGRLRPGASIEKARAEINVLFPRILEERAGTALSKDLLPDPDRMHVDVASGAAGFSYLRQQITQPLFTLMGMVALVLVVACANVANLLLERAMARKKEIAVRLALGAGSGRLIRQLLTESVPLSGLGGLLGLAFAFWASRALLRLIGGASSAAAVDLRPDFPVLAFTASVAILTGILFGLAPAFRATRVELAPTLKEGSRSVVGSGSRARWPLRKLLVAAQFALSLLLVMGAGLFVGTLRNLQRLDLGYPRDQILMVNVDPFGAGYEGGRLESFPRDMIERLRAIPGVRGVSYSTNGLFSGTESSTTVRSPSFETPAEGVSLHYDLVGPDYFKAVGIPLLLGRGIEVRDGTGGPPVAVINEAMAKERFPGESPLGKRLVMQGPPDVEYEIVGVVANARDHDLRGAVPPRFYVPMTTDDPDLDFNFEIRTSEPAALVEPVRKAIQSYDPDLPMTDLEPLATMIDDSIVNERIIARLSAVFGLLALLLAAIGLYGVISYTIARRTNEIGIRMALGARRPIVLWMVLRETLLLALAGIVLGVPAALGSTRAVASRLFGLSFADPVTLAATVGILLVVALCAGLIPGSRATRVSPVQALRYE
jgi:predicted permease